MAAAVMFLAYGASKMMGGGGGGGGGKLVVMVLVALVGLYLFFECRSGIPLLKKCCHWCDSDLKRYITLGVYLLLTIIIIIISLKKKKNK